MSFEITDGEFLTISWSIGITCSVLGLFSTTWGSFVFPIWCDGSICGLGSSGLGGAIRVLGVLCRELNTGGAGNPGGVVGTLGITSSSDWVAISCCCRCDRGAILGGFTKWANNRGLSAAGSTGISGLIFFSIWGGGNDGRGYERDRDCDGNCDKRWKRERDDERG
ncbi:unnamed protein product [Rotaria sp. Silwood1]|nr:unnamed protein product [Rotaria sp. Silwood1]